MDVDAAELAASSPAAAAPPPAPPVEGEDLQPLDLGALTGAQYDKWRQTGDFPDATPKPAESAPAQVAAPKPGETPPAPEPEKKIEEPGKPRGAEARKEQLATEIQEILRERREARRELDDLRATLARERGDTTAPPAARAETTEPMLKEYLEKAETYEDAAQEFQRAHSKWAFGQYQTEAQAVEQQRALAEQREAFSKRVEKDSVDYADFDTVTAGAGALKLTPAMLGAVYESDIPGKLLYHLAKAPDEFRRIAALTPARAIRELGRIEDTLIAAAQPKTNGTPAPPLKLHSTAPPPPTELAARNTAAGDEAEAALADKDFARYRQIMDERDLKKKRT